MTTMPYAESTHDPQTKLQPHREAATPADAGDPALLASAMGDSEATFTTLCRGHSQAV